MISVGSISLETVYLFVSDNYSYEKAFLMNGKYIFAAIVI